MMCVCVGDVMDVVFSVCIVRRGAVGARVWGPTFNPQQLSPNHAEKKPCKFYMQCHCMHGKQGSACAYPHPPMCFKYIKRGPKGCAKGTSCKFAYPKLCRASLFSGKCNCNRCYFYHVINSKITENSISSHERSSNYNRATPLMHLNLPPYKPPQAKTASLNSNHIQHLTQSQNMPSYMVHPYQTVRFVVRL